MPRETDKPKGSKDNAKVDVSLDATRVTYTGGSELTRVARNEGMTIAQKYAQTVGANQQELNQKKPGLLDKFFKK